MIDPKFTNYNDAGEQRSFDLIPAGSIVPVQLTVRPGGAGDDGWLKKSKDGLSEALDCELTVLEGEYAKRKLWALYTIQGTTPGHTEAGEISRKALCAMLEAARAIRPDDKSEAAQKGRQVAGWSDFDGLCFLVRVGVRRPQGDFAAKNTITEVITSERRDWRKIEPPPLDPSKSRVAPAAPSSPSTATPPAQAISRPNWAR